MAGKGGRRSTTWGPGQGGNKPKDPVKRDIQQLAKALGPEIIERLAVWMRSSHASASPAAAQILLDRGFGKAIQRQELTGADGGPIQTEQIEDNRVPLGEIVARARAATETKH